MNRYNSPSDSIKLQAFSAPWGFSSASSKKPPYKLAIPEMTQPDTLRIDPVEPFDAQAHVRANELTFKRQQQSMSSGRNPFSEDYLRINTTENTRLNVSIGNSEIVFEKETLDSPILMEIPCERINDPHLTIYKTSKENTRALETCSDNYLPTNDTLSKESKHFFGQPPSIEIRMRTLPDNDIKPIERNTSYERPAAGQRKASMGSANKSKRKHYENMLEEILQREKENRVTVRLTTEPNNELLLTPKLGRNPSRSSSVTHRRKSNCVSQKRPNGEMNLFLKEDPKETLNKLKNNIEEANKEREYLKIYVQQLKSMVKKEQDETQRVQKNAKAIEHEITRLNNKQKQVEKSGMDIKDQLRKTKEEVLKLLEDVEMTRKSQVPLVEKINEDKDYAEVQKKKVEVLRANLAQELKEKEVQKETIANLKRIKQRLVLSKENLEREKLAFMAGFEQRMVENCEQ